MEGNEVLLTYTTAEYGTVMVPVFYTAVTSVAVTLKSSGQVKGSKIKNTTDSYLLLSFVSWKGNERNSLQSVADENDGISCSKYI